MGDGTVMMERLKAQRDRFIAFAFAGADLLLELSDQNLISYSAGAGEALYGLSDADLMGKPLADLIHPKDRKRFDEALLRLKNAGRLDHTPLLLMGAEGAVTRMRMAGIRLPQFPSTCHVVLSRVPPVAADDACRFTGDVDHKADFVEMVRTRLNEANRIGADYTLTLFDLSGTNFGSIEPALAQTFLSTVHQTLTECSVKGASAGALAAASFGLVHDDKTSAADVHRRIVAVADKFAGKTGGAGAVKMHSASLEMEDSQLSDGDISKALAYIVNGFVRDSAAFSLQSLADGARVAMQDTLVRVRNFRKMIKGEDKLVFLFQPIVNVRSGAVLLYEAFSRISHNGTFFTPNQIIPFATDVGVIGEFDLIAVGKALKILKEPGEVSALANIAVNISGQSLGNPAFYHTLLKLMDQYRPVLGRLVLEITDASRIYNLDEARRLLLRIRKMGTRISLDDFGSGGAAFELLRLLPVDFAKFDPDYIRDARDPKGRSVLKAMTGLCRDLNIISVGECVEDEATLRHLADIGIDYAQGYYFGQPAADAAKRIKYFTEQVKRAGTAEPGLAIGG
jgi:EAL domain-containing protein (putative c-di-GMP-specific phosphodiesterase class I)